MSTGSVVCFVSACVLYVGYVNFRRRIEFQTPAPTRPRAPYGFWNKKRVSAIIKERFDIDVVVLRESISFCGDRRTVFISDTRYREDELGEKIASFHGQGLDNVYIRTTIADQRSILKQAVSALYAGWDVYEVTDDAMDDLLGKSEFAQTIMQKMDDDTLKVGENRWSSIDGKLIPVPYTDTLE
jgi:hypothetical protein